MRAALLLLAATLAACSRTEPAPAPPRLSFVVFLTDDQSRDMLGCAGNSYIRTPGMDRLAAQGVRFERAFVTTPVCAVSRASLLTGQHMRRHGVVDFERPLSAQQWQETFPALLRAAGYRTAYLGKYAIGWPERADPQLCLPAERFDLWYGFPQVVSYRQVVDGETVHLTTAIERKAEAFLRGLSPSEPFCLVVGFKEPHGPYDYFDPQVPELYADTVVPPPVTMTPQALAALPECVRASHGVSDAVRAWMEDPQDFHQVMRRAYRMVSRADLAIERITDLLAELGLDQRTVVILTSDNGNLAGAHGLVGKWLMYEESIGVPLILVDPRLPADLRGRTSPELALNIDLAPTILSMAGLPVPARMQGLDLTPLLRERSARGREDWYGEHLYTPGGENLEIPPSECVRTRRWKYIRYTGREPVVEQLFDLQADPLETRDLAAEPEHAATLAQLRARCDELAAQAR